MTDRGPGSPDARATLGPDAPTFEDWVEVRFARLVRFAYLVTGSQQAADDAVQTALAQACARWSRVGRTDDPDVYVRRMVVNAHVSAWRRSGRRELSVAEVRDGASSVGGDPGDDVARDDAVWRVCLALPPRQRAAVVLRFYEDLDYPEIARVLDVAEATVRSHVHRGLTAMRLELTHDPDNSEEH
ncbi:SigE family RNA polymerase sigma factor [Nocardioides plantarum]|uniref:SigE family RNA polymerase sigma factor n=1 Tax=Nocardioides plantarum TaxID=29299 RepID=A0ABV5K543_9ACTN|nr:SigE family RNA polymerase sigma factor [Nocardioides plantarum]